MRFASIFRLATFACLLASTVTLAYTEAFQLAHSSAFYVAIVAMIVVAYLSEEKWLLPSGLANWVAGAIFFAWLAWFIVGLHWDDNDPIGSVLPRAGPLLGLLLLAKLFRPKQPVDYWLLHALGLVQTLLACVLGLRTRVDREDGVFNLLLIAYVASLVWSSVLFNLYRETEWARRPGRSNHAPADAMRLSWRTLGVAPAVGWSVLAFVCGLVIFFAIPRPGQEITASVPALMPGASTAEVGFNPGADLNNVGPISVSDAEVMKVEAFDAAGRKLRLDSDQIRFRGVTCSEYVGGRWQPYGTHGQYFLPQDVSSQEQAERLKPKDHLRVTYNVDVSKLQTSGGMMPYEVAQKQALFLLDPIYLAPPQRAPVTYPERTGIRGTVQFSYRKDEPAMEAALPRRTRRLIYHQFNLMPSAATPAEEWSDEASIYAELIATEAAPVNRLPWWQVVRQVLPPDKADAQALLEQKAAEILTKSKVPTLDKAREDRLSPGERRQLAINRAKALERYLALSDEYSYALDHRRKDDKLDPTVDFLCNVKEGHCELFASALALMLRSQGIPARVVIGFRGADWNEVGEWHEVRQYNAHAWVEAFIETEPPPSTVRNTPVRNVAELRNKLPRGRWLTLDPSPAGGTAGATAATGTGTLRDLLSFIQFLWEFFVLDYTGDVQRERLMLRFKELRLDETQRFWADLVRSLPRGLIVVVGVAGAFTVGSVVFWLLRARWRKRHAAFYALASRFPFYARFLKLAQRLGAYVGPAQTAAELGEAVRSLVSQRPECTAVVGTPAAVVASFYDVRYGGQALDERRTLELSQQIGRLEEFCTQQPRAGQ